MPWLLFSFFPFFLFFPNENGYFSHISTAVNPFEDRNCSFRFSNFRIKWIAPCWSSIGKALVFFSFFWVHFCAMLNWKWKINTTCYLFLSFISLSLSLSRSSDLHWAKVEIISRLATLHFLIPQFRTCPLLIPVRNFFFLKKNLMTKKTMSQHTHSHSQMAGSEIPKVLSLCTWDFWFLFWYSNMGGKCWFSSQLSASSLQQFFWTLEREWQSQPALALSVCHTMKQPASTACLLV